MRDLEDKLFSGLHSANIISGIVFAIVSVGSFVIIYGGTLFQLDSLIANLSLLGVVSFVIGFFIQGIRYLGFKYYIKLWKKSKEKNHLGILQRIIFYLFRKGTVVEECMYVKKNDSERYPWIQGSQQPVKDMWLYANKIRKIAPEENVYRFYYWSEIFQCLDTTFVLLGIVFFICFIINTWLYTFMGMYFQITILQIIISGISALSSLVFHRVSKGCSSVYADRFLFAIDKGVTGNSIELEK
jgi:hypothetical protein